MTTYTATQWATRALQRASITAEDDTPTAAQIAWAIAVGGSLFDECIGQGIRFPAGSSSALPSEYYRVFPTLVACDLKVEVGLMNEADAIQAKDLLKNTIRSINWQQPIAAAASGEYF